MIVHIFLRKSIKISHYLFILTVLIFLALFYIFNCNSRDTERDFYPLSWNNFRKQVKYYSTNKEIIPKISTLNPWWVTGFVDAEGSFSMSIFKSKTAAIGWTIEPCFIITLHVRDLELLYSIKNFFSVGSVSIVGTDARFRVRSRSELKIIIAHFEKYHLQTTKARNFRYFCEILNLINNRVHTNISGFLRLASLINRLNKPLSESLLTKLVELGPLPKAEFETISNFNKVEILNPWWISGFAEGEGSFTYFTRTRVNSAGKTVKDYSLVFEISQRTQDLHVLNLIVSYFKVGNVYTETSGISRYRLRINNENISQLIPHFKYYPLVGHKSLQYSAWLKIVYFLNDQVRTDKRDIELEILKKDLSGLK